MKKEVWRGPNSARFIYLSYKDTPYFSLLVISLFIFVGIILIFNIIIPQTQNWFSIREETIATRNRIDTIKKNITYISGMNKTALENNRQTVIRALPVEKDFENIINAVAASSALSGISVNDFSFYVGPVATSSGKVIRNNSGLDLIYVNLALKGDIDKIRNFIAGIEEKMPLSEIVSIETGKDGSNLSIQFYSKPYRPISTSDFEPIQPITIPNTTMLGKLSSWNQGIIHSSEETPIAPSAEIPLF